MASQNKIINELKNLAKKTLESNERFHDYGHAISVFNNANKIITGEKVQKKVSVLAVLTAALFHDISSENKHDSLESAKMIPELLSSVEGYPKDLIEQVQRLVASVEGGAMDENAMDELIINEADSLEALSKLSICRGFMLYGRKGSQVEPAIEDFKNYIDKKYNELNKKGHTKTAKKISKERISFIRKFLADCLKIY